jgi:hypothetical protein
VKRRTYGFCSLTVNVNISNSKLEVTQAHEEKAIKLSALISNTSSVLSLCMGIMEIAAALSCGVLATYPH